MSAKEQAMQRYFTLSDGARLAYDLHGEEHLEKKDTLPFVLMGGVSNTKVDWERLLPHISKTRAVLTFDYRGIGLSKYSTPKEDDRLTLESMALDVIALIQSFGWKEVDILGFSLGGVILQQILLFHKHPTFPVQLPFRVRYVVLTASFASTLPPEYIPQPLPRTVGSTPVQDLTNEQKKELTRPLVEALLGSKWVSAPENRKRFDVWLENSIVNRPFSTIMRQRKMVARFSFVEDLKFIEPGTEILVIHGMEDVIVPFSMSEEILRACPQARLVSVGSKPGDVPSYAFGHIWYEYFDVEVWVKVLEAFLDKPVGARL